MSAANAHPCPSCLRRSWLVARLAGHIDVAWSGRRGRADLLSLTDGEMIEALAGGDRASITAEYDRFDPALLRERCGSAHVTALCRCDPRYPPQLDELPDPPAVLYVHGAARRLETGLERGRVAIVGARRATPYGLEQAQALGRGAAAAGLTVISGMALGVDAAAHLGALEVDGLTIAVLACGPEMPYPRTKRRLHERIAATGAVVAELPPGTRARRWCFPARNRLIAALAQATVVVEATERSGSLITAGLAADLGREVGAVPGLVTAPQATGTNALIADGARLVRGVEDVLETLFGAEATRPMVAPPSSVVELDADLRELLDAVRSGRDTVGALAGAGFALDAALAGLAQLELRGLVRRGPGGRYVAVGRG